MKLLTGKDHKSNTYRLAQMAKEDPNGLFFAKDMNSLNEVKKDHPELGDRLFLAHSASHAVGRKQTNAYVEDIAGSGYNMRDNVQNGFTLCGATFLNAEHEEVPEGSAPEPEDNEQTEGKDPEVARNTAVESTDDAAAKGTTGLDEFGNPQAKHFGEEPVAQQAEHVDHESSYSHAYKSADAQKEAEKNSESNRVLFSYP